MIDTHTHLQFRQFEGDLEQVMKSMTAESVSHGIVVGTDVQTSLDAVALAGRYANLYAAIGIHPGDVTDINLEKAIQDLERAISTKTVAIGEIGLDYKVFDDQEPDKKAQTRVLEQMIDLANRHNLPAILHSREAEKDVIDFVRKRSLKKGGVVHCFSADYETAKYALDSGLMISFTAMITYPKNEDLRRVVAKMPHDRVMLETDCPFLPPQSKRGQRNDPSYLPEIAIELASLWGYDLDYVDRVTSTNAGKFFGIP